MCVCGRLRVRVCVCVCIHILPNGYKHAQHTDTDTTDGKGGRRRRGGGLQVLWEPWDGLVEPPSTTAMAGDGDGQMKFGYKRSTHPFAIEWLWLWGILYLVESSRAAKRLVVVSSGQETQTITGLLQSFTENCARRSIPKPVHLSLSFEFGVGCCLVCTVSC